MASSTDAHRKCSVDPFIRLSLFRSMRSRTEAEHGMSYFYLIGRQGSFSWELHWFCTEMRFTNQSHLDLEDGNQH
jgi:hypothetical protein